MNQEITLLHNAIVDQLKETATNSYNKFYRAYESLKEDKEASKEAFETILRNNDYVIASLDFYDDKFRSLDRSEDYLYIGQILSLQIKACHNLNFINQNEDYNEKKNNYKILLYFYYLMAKELEKIGLIMEAFVKDALIGEEEIKVATNKYQKYIQRKVEN